MQLEEIKQGSIILGLLPQRPVEVHSVTWRGSKSVEVIYRDPAGLVASRILFRTDEHRLQLAQAGQPWSLEADGAALRLVSEAERIHLAHLFDPYLAIHLSTVDPLPHQITAVYDILLQRDRIRFLLADDPGAGKTIMAGLLIRELQVRGDLQRCLIVCPGVLVEQWQDELFSKFGVQFDIMTREAIEASRTGNWFGETDLAICRLDMLSRNESLQEQLGASHWDLIVVDEAHKMSASYFGSDLKLTKRYRLGQLLSRLTRHYLLMTATPHNGHDEDFQLFLALLDGDRFEGKFRDGAHQIDTSDLMRRMVKEELLTMDGKKLFPPRFAHVAPYALSPLEAALYAAVTEYVREEFQRVERMADEGRKRTVGFALTVLQRRLASSPEAILRSLERRRDRLQREQREMETYQRGSQELLRLTASAPPEDIQEWEDEAPAEEVENFEDQVTDLATAAQTITELRLEIQSLERLVVLAQQVHQSEEDSKWVSLASLLQQDAGLTLPSGDRRKLVIFTEHRDTLHYLRLKLETLLGTPEAIVCIHGSMGREERKKSETRFKTDDTALILLATDAAGEGINLQVAHLMVNYDLPWNPNRIEQRFGRIHRIGQREPCHLWNLVSTETVEGYVYGVLLRKLEVQRANLGDKVFDVLGQVTFGENRSLRELMLTAIRTGESPELRAQQEEILDVALDQLRDLIDEHALIHDVMETRRVQDIRRELARAHAMRLQPRYIGAFFADAFARLGGQLIPREPDRFEIPHVPVELRRRDREIGTREHVAEKYQRVTFDKTLRSLSGKVPAEFLCPGHPLLDATIDLIREQYGHLLRQGAILVDPADPTTVPRWLVFLRHEVRGGPLNVEGRGRLLSARMQFVFGSLEQGAEGDSARIRSWEAGGNAPYLDCRPLEPEEIEPCREFFQQPGWQLAPCETEALAFAIEELVEPHLAQVTERQWTQLDKIHAAVRARLTVEYNYLDLRASELREKEAMGKQQKRSAADLERRADDLRERLQQREAELQAAREIWAEAPVVIGGALILPQGLLDQIQGRMGVDSDATAAERKRIEFLAMQAVLRAERSAGRLPEDVGALKRGWDVESLDPETGDTLFIEVKGRTVGADTVTVTSGEQRAALNDLEHFRLALVSVDGEATTLRYVREPFAQAPEFHVASTNYHWRELWERGRHAANDP
ncbi:MAG: RNA polymerase-associated protein RapA [bacterium]|nr:RNA polymerase-associated protein RapA [bacterium]